MPRFPGFPDIPEIVYIQELRGLYIRNNHSLHCFRYLVPTTIVITSIPSLCTSRLKIIPDPYMSAKVDTCDDCEAASSYDDTCNRSRIDRLHNERVFS